MINVMEVEGKAIDTQWQCNERLNFKIGVIFPGIYFTACTAVVVHVFEFNEYAARGDMTYIAPLLRCVEIETSSAT